MNLDEAGATVKYLIRDRDAKFPALFDRILTDAGIGTELTGVRVAAPELDHGAVGADLPPRTPRPDTDLERTPPTALPAPLRTPPQRTPPHHGMHQAAPLRAVPAPITDPDLLAYSDIRRNDRLGGIIHEYQHAA
jgi:hypothetical protein